MTALGEADIASSDWYGWFNDEETTYHLQQHYSPNTPKRQSEFLARLQSDDSVVQFGIVSKDEQTIAGVISIQEIDTVNRNAEIAMVIGEPEYRKLVYAQDAMRLAIEHAFHTLNLHKVYVGYLETLATWGEFLKKRFAFKDEGIWRQQVYKRGKYLDVHRLGLLRDEYSETGSDVEGN